MPELPDCKIRVGDDVQDPHGAFRVGSHDDLVTGLGSPLGAALARVEGQEAFEDSQRTSPDSICKAKTSNTSRP